jgi:hypothetical protein
LEHSGEILYRVLRHATTSIAPSTSLNVQVQEDQDQSQGRGYGCGLGCRRRGGRNPNRPCSVFTIPVIE